MSKKDLTGGTEIHVTQRWWRRGGVEPDISTENAQVTDTENA